MTRYCNENLEESDEDAIDRFVATIRNGRFIDISSIDSKALEIIAGESSFEVRY